MGAAAPLSVANEPAGSTQRTLVFRLLAILVGALFMYAGVVKLVDPLRFASDITNYDIVPWSIAVRLAFYLPWLELLCGLALVFYRFFSGALALTISLMVIFIGASVITKARGIDVSCGCFGSISGNLSFTWHLVLDFVLLAILVVLWLKARRPAPASTSVPV
jgi:hypothetical protein